MPTLNWLGKDAVLNHHLDVPYRTLELKESFNCESGKSENKIIHGDNLEALKALLPEYEGRVKCIYIDPPYNTGNENWVYNDNVNSPKIKKWLGQVVGKESEDLTRHDKWLCMMYPRLKLLQKLLSEDGAIFISIDDNEQANLKLICDEIFGAGNFVAQVIWERAYAPVNLKKHFSESHDYILCYGKNIEKLVCNGLPRTEDANNRYSNPDNDPRGVWKASDCSVGPVVEEKVYEIELPSQRKVLPSKGRCWLYTKERFTEMVHDNRIWFGPDGNSVPAVKKFLSEVKQGITPMTIWKYTEVGHSQDATKKLKEIFDGKAVFDYPKSVDLLKRCFELYSDKSSIILDSFAGSGTTAHAVLNLNKQDGGNRKFILVEMEDYANTITAERVRRVINGYASTEGTGGDFNFYELGPEMILDGNLNERQSVEKIRSYIYYAETGTPINKEKVKESKHEFFLGDFENTAYYLFYKKKEITTLDFDFLSTIQTPSERYVIYADNCVLPKDFLFEHNITFKKIPRDVRKF
ncbi:site-specific DNA-methyltransferase [Candidatus Saccharibacteria bacterium]|nr:site-specific DNA-methyltransferase [Candidatus Saccharibacteria bacterium]